MDSPLALYRRYRPETFSQVIGQDHVTVPLRNALANDRVNHAYLFSGPRGCGKTTSARILARTLNCAQAPTAEPCGECDSCRDLATGGRGSIDVIEIDAASHGGVDDARDLREKAYFAPVRDRYKIYIIDEAHMVTNQGFNALLKLVEEPPPHLRFIFATTEPEKVIPTIRSRTHHYPFRLIPPRMLSDYVGELCQREGVPIEPAAVPLVVRAGAGSARDTLSVLDQLIGGSGPEGVTHELAVALLGFTPDSLLDEIVDAFSASDGNGVFRVVDKVIESGQDPRRFAEDLLRRLRDLVVVAAVPDAPSTGLIDCSQDQGERLVAQAARFGKSDLSRAADLLATGLLDMKGAVSPRLLLELICARVLLPGADDSADGVQARLDRMEKRQGIVGNAPAGPTPAGPTPTGPGSAGLSPQAPGQPVGSPSGSPVDARAAARAAVARVQQASPQQAAPQAPAQQPESHGPATGAPAVAAPHAQSQPLSPAQSQQAAQSPVGQPQDSGWPTPAPPGSGASAANVPSSPAPGAEPQGWGRPPAQQSSPAAPAPTPAPAPAAEAPASPAPVEPEGWGRPARAAEPEQVAAPQAVSATAPTFSLADVRRLWPDVVEATRTRRRLAWMLLTQNAQVTGVDGNVVTLGFNNPGARESFVKGGNDEVLRQAAIDVVGADWRIECVVDAGATPSASSAASHTVVQPAVPQPPAPASQQAAQQASAPQAAAPQGVQQPGSAPVAPPQEQHRSATPDWVPPLDDVPPPPYDEGPPDPYDPGPPPGYDAAPANPAQQHQQRQAQPSQGGRGALDRAREAIQQTRSAEGPAVSVDDQALADAAVSPDDQPVDDSGMDSTQLLERTLGARLIEEIPHN